ncbi:MAG: hypothetical protein KC609_14130 [Myxococcales bacterium]|nr:hypothetical protein [Myxococcales bacterium]
METVLQQFVSQIDVGRCQSYKNLAIYPVFYRNGAKLEYRVLDEALAQESVDITEISEQGSIPELRVHNKGDRHVLMVDGEELLGAKQNRIVNASFLIPPERQLVVPVSCVEQGRWKYESGEKFTTSKLIYTARARRQKCKSTTVSLRLKNGFLADQGEIWDTVTDYLMGSGTLSQTAAFNDFYRRREEEVESYFRRFRPHRDQVGNLVYVNGEFIVFDSFAKPATLGRLFPKLLRSYALDAVDRNEDFNIYVPTSPKRGSSPTNGKPSWFERLFRRQRPSHRIAGHSIRESEKPVAQALGDVDVQTYVSVGDGDDLRFENKFVMGSALVYNEQLVHVNFFPN